MSLIEKAAKRLEELRRAGVELPDLDEAPPKRATKSPIAKRDDDTVPFVNPFTAPKIEPSEEPSPALAKPRRASTRPNSAKIKGHVNLDLRNLEANGFIIPTASRQRIADEFRDLKRTLLANASGKTVEPIADGNLVMVTSAVPGEGKTFSAINLAMSIAMELDWTVLLVDADVARPSLPGTLGLPPGKGLLDVLQDSSIDLADVLLTTNVEKLTIFPSGEPRAHATELLASDAMVTLLEDLAGEHDNRIIVFDSPPILATTEARTLATHMGQIVFVVRAESTQQSQVKQGLKEIEACPVKLLLLNQANAGPQDPYGPYGYGGF